MTYRGAHFLVNNLRGAAYITCLYHMMGIVLDQITMIITSNF